jgi:hypothetical protein
LTACEAAQDSRFFGRRFDEMVAVRFFFLFDAVQQRRLLAHVATAMAPGARLFFIASRVGCAWRNTLTTSCRAYWARRSMLRRLLRSGCGLLADRSMTAGSTITTLFVIQNATRLTDIAITDVL